MRLCPICDTKTEALMCPNDGYQTIDLAVFQDDKATDPFVGRVLAGRYRILRRLGSGGMGSVYLGLNIPLKQEIAIKVMYGELAHDVNAVKRFHREALTTSRLSHPNTVRVFDFGQEPDGMLFLVMEYVKGMPLSHVISTTGRLPATRVLAITRQVLGALAEAHAAGIVHRDLKPQNIMMMDMPGAGDFAKVVDFGIAKIATTTGETSLTKAGVSIGSPPYMSPEQAEGKSIDHRTDLYSLGVIMYEMLSGHTPFQGDTPLAVLVKHMTEPPPSLPDDVPQALARVVMTLLEKKPEMRPQSANDALAMLDAPDILVLDTSAEGALRRASRHMEIVPAAFPRTDPVPSVRTADIKALKRGRSWVLPVVAGTVLLAGIVVVALAFVRGSSTPVAQTETAVSTTSTSTVTQEHSEQSLKTMTAPSQPVVRTVTIKSNPSGAYVKEGLAVLGVTPITLEVIEGKTRTIKVEKPGYSDQTAVINGLMPEIEVRLDVLESQKVLEKAVKEDKRGVAPKSVSPKPVPVKKRPAVELFE